EDAENPGDGSFFSLRLFSATSALYSLRFQFCVVKPAVAPFSLARIDGRDRLADDFLERHRFELASFQAAQWRNVYVPPPCCLDSILRALKRRPGRSANFI